MSSKTSYYKDPDADRLVVELASAVQAELNQRRLFAVAAARQTPVGISTLYGLLKCDRVSLDTYTALARWAGYEVVLTPRGKT